MNKALKALKEIEWMDVDGQRDELCPVCGRPHHMQHAQWCQLDRAIGFLEREPKCKTCNDSGKTNKLAECLDGKVCMVEKNVPCPDCAEQPKAGEFTKTLEAIQICFDDDCGAFLDSEWYDFKKLWKEVRCHIDRLEEKIKFYEKYDKDADGYMAKVKQLQAQLVAKDEETAGLQEQLIKMCRVFHSIDCVCKWCNIAKERAVAGT